MLRAARLYHGMQFDGLCPGCSGLFRPAFGTSDNLASVKLVPIWQQLQELAAGFPASEKGVNRA